MHKPSEAKPLRILVVDDEEIVREVIRNALERPGIFLVDAADGERAIELLLREPFDLLVVDKNLPGITGLDVIRRAKATDPTIATLLITAFASRESAEEAMAIGVDDYLIKPFGIADLLAKVTEAQERRLGRRKAASLPVRIPLKLRVLVCEPDAANRQTLVEAMRLLGYKVAEASGLSQVLAEVQNRRADAVICSLALLDQETPTACFLRSALLLSPAVRFVAVAGQRELLGAVSALRHGAGKVIYLPLGGPTQVAEALGGYLRGESPVAKPASGSGRRIES